METGHFPSKIALVSFFQKILIFLIKEFYKTLLIWREFRTMLEMAFFNADFKFVESSTPFSKQDRATFRILCVSSYEDSAFFFLDTLAAPDGSRKSVTFAQTV